MLFSPTKDFAVQGWALGSTMPPPSLQLPQVPAGGGKPAHVSVVSGYTKLLPGCGQTKLGWSQAARKKETFIIHIRILELY